ncbi:MAG: nitrate- and nitrite sensing domain-containing protein [Acidimicrobiia bacterium]
MGGTLFKNLSFKSKMALFVAPLVLALVALATALVQPKLEMANRADASEHQAEVAVSAMQLIDVLMEERGLSMWISAGGTDLPEGLADVRAEVDARSKAYASRIEAVDALPDGTDTQLAAAQVAIDELSKLRGEIDAQVLSTSQIFDEYSATIDALRTVAGSLGTNTDDQQLAASGTAAFNIMLAKHKYGELRDLLVARVAAGALDDTDVATVVDLEARRALYLANFSRAARNDAQTRFATIDNSAQAAIANELVEQARTAGAEGIVPEFSDAEWWDGMSGVVDGYDTVEQAEFDLVVTLASEIKAEATAAAIRYALLAAAAVLAAIVAALVISRSIVRRLANISSEAQHIATVRLPEVLEVLRNPTREDLAAALPQVRSDATDEVGNLATAFNAVLSTAVETGLEHAQRRAQTVNNMLVNLGRRNQALIDRQLQVMDRLESSVQDPDVLQGLFDVDHMVTRMRRNAENLLVLAGHQQARGWTAPVPLADVLQGAASESPDMTRVDIEVDPTHNIEMSGAYAVDVSHIVAELVENAIAYSSPATQVEVRTDRGNQGEIVVHVADSGVGMSGEDLSAANERLASPPDIDEIATDRVGFQVVGRLARRIGVTVELSDRTGGGVLASVTLPKALFAGEEREPAGGAAPKKQRDDSVFKKVEGRRLPEADSASFDDEELLATDLQTLLSGPDAPAVAPAPDPDAITKNEGTGLVKRRPGTAYTGNSKAAEADAGVFKRLPDAEPASAPAAVATDTGTTDAADAAGDGDPDAEAAYGRFRAMSALQSAVLQGRNENDETPATEEP